ncbi:hypothetical protein B0H14DRAFT_2606858 [Mycena olivaceomarginata]|nr:hypothetical protein B0H14DRAFT_2606858 [Mycena olivaceomarginata]
MAGVVVPSCGSGKDHGTTINGKLWPFPFATGNAHMIMRVYLYNWEFPDRNGTSHEQFFCDGNALAVMGRTFYAWELPVLNGMFQIGSGPSLETLAVFLLFSGTTYSRTCMVIWKSVESSELRLLNGVDTSLYNNFREIRRLFARKCAATSAQVPIYAGRLVLGAGFTDHGGIKISSYRWTDWMNQSGSQGMIVRIKLCASPILHINTQGGSLDEVQYTLYSKISGLDWAPHSYLRDGAQTQTICKAAKACKGFQIHPFAAQYMQKCTQYCNFFGPCDVTPWEIPHQKWEAQMDNMGSPDMHTWASHTVPTPAVVLPSTCGNSSQI